MSKSLLRILFLLPVIAGALIAFSSFGERSLPQPAREYVQWYLHQPLDGISLVFNRLALIGLVMILVSTIGLVLFWSLARYAYVFAVFCALPDQFTALPTLVTGWENILDNIAQLLIGLNIGLIFSLPGSYHFHPGN